MWKDITDWYQKHFGSKKEAPLPKEDPCNPHTPTTGTFKDPLRDKADHLGMAGMVKAGKFLTFPEYLEKHPLTDPAQIRRWKQIEPFITEVSKNMDQHLDGAFIYVGQTELAARAVVEPHNKKVYFNISEATLQRVLQSDHELTLLKSDIGHEMTHLYNKDLIFGNAKNELRRTYEGHRLTEMLADLGGAGPLAAHNASVGADKMNNFLKDKDMVESYNHYHPCAPIFSKNLSEADLKKISDWTITFSEDYPTFLDRRTALLDEGKRMKEYEQQHKVVTLEDKKIENAFVISEVLADMKGKWQLPMATSTEYECPAPPSKPVPKTPRGH